MFMTVILCVAALLLGAAVGWAVASAKSGARAQRAMVERDLAIAERARSEAAVSAARARLEEAQRARVAAETRLEEAERLVADKKTMEDAFDAIAQRALKNVG